MNKINYIVGDATEPIGDGPKIICHVCNSGGKWGSGFVVALSKKWREPERVYRDWYKKDKNLPLGEIQLSITDTVYQGLENENITFVCNMIAQEGVGIKNGIPPIRYNALRSCLEQVYWIAKELGATIHGPRFGSDRAGGDWNVIERIIEDELTSKGISVTIYDLR